ncbi:predicted zinc-binding protein [Vibrio sp. RC586]|uniref:zinc uptake protein ZrgA n=1 Tax=Vibrio sp. RC586 TaxID=675815 RepID=UPI0001BB8681|nr:DUF2796 domain-containing protein [Vibrio sp. RC586]EEZ00945.1 predicted zinc-binding protein [Vibrio sp. RC586]
MHYPTFLALMVGATLSGNALADHQHRQHEAHVHGQVELNIAQDGHDLLIEITAPGADVIGFEHAPQDEAQQKVLKQALDTLHLPKELFVLNNKAQCETRDVLIKHNLGGEEHEDHHSHQEGEAHDHDTAHDHSEHDHAAHDHQGHDHEGDEHDDEHQHGTFTVQYQFHCEAINELKQIDTQWFQHFPSTEKIQTNVLTEKQQSALQLNAKQTRISL